MKKRILFAAAFSLLAAADAPDLSKMEAALASDANNIRLGSEYRQAVIKANGYDRSLKFFEKLVADNPKAGNAYLNYGFAYVDKIPAAGSITQVILANTALGHFSKYRTAAELDRLLHPRQQLFVLAENFQSSLSWSRRPRAGHENPEGR